MEKVYGALAGVQLMTNLMDLRKIDSSLNTYRDGRHTSDPGSSRWEAYNDMIDELDLYVRPSQQNKIINTMGCLSEEEMFQIGQFLGSEKRYEDLSKYFNDCLALKQKREAEQHK